MFGHLCQYFGIVCLLSLLVACGGGRQGAGSGSSSGGVAGSSSSSSSSSSSASGSVGWEFCATDAGMCNFAGSRVVRYGAGGLWSEGVYTNGVRCDAEVFRAASGLTNRYCEIGLTLITPVVSSSSSSSSSSTSGLPGQPPYQGTVFIDRDIIRPGDPSSYRDMVYTGQAERRAWHSERGTVVTFNAYTYSLQFGDSPPVEISVEDLIGSESTARAEAERLAIPLGQIPALLRASVTVVTVFSGAGRGTASAGGLISTYSADNTTKIRDGYLEEFLVHEATHTSLDAKYYADPEFQLARLADNNYVSTYARDNANSEDIAESMVPYIAVRYRADRITAEMEGRIRAAMANRIRFFDAQNLNFAPVHDTSAAVRSRLLQPEVGGTLAGQEAVFEWNATPGATLYELTLGATGPGSSDILTPQSTVDNVLHVANLPDNGGRVHVRLGTQLQGRWRYEDYAYYGFDRYKTAAEMQRPRAGTSLRSTSVTVVWDKPAGATHFDLHVGDQGVGSSNLRSSHIVTGTALELTALPVQGQTLYLRLFTKSDEWYYRDYTLVAANNSARAQLLVPVPGEPRPPGASLEFIWDAPLSARSYDLLIGTSGPGSTDIRSSQVMNTNRVRVETLPTDGRRLYVRLWTLTNDWAYRDYEF